MTTGDLGRGLGQEGLEAQFETGSAAAGEPRQTLSAEEVVAIVDHILSGPGRRRHLFTWLRAPGADNEDWLAVDAYYPAHRLVVVCQDTASEHESVFSELVPAHGLRLLEVRLAECSAGRQAARQLLERRIAELGPPPEPRAAPAAATSTSAAVAPARQPAASGAMRGADTEAAGVLAGIVLIGALVIEIYFGVAQVGFGSGNLLLAFGLSLDACARVLGTIAAWRAREREWAWWCAIGGSPLAVGFALMQSSGPVKTEPAPLAGIISMGAVALLALAALISAFGG